jgi:hypothetical protein
MPFFARSSKNDEKNPKLVYNVSTKLFLWRQIMLTNNKKRSFVKLIALTLAALMVFSVCLTGCTDEDARLAADAAKDAADKAQSSADAAQTAADGKTTAEAVAAQIAEALKPYLKAEDAVSEADVDKKVADLKAAIEASLKDYQAKGDYATKADLNKYQAKGDYATKADLKALSGFASSSELKTLSDKVANLTKSAVTAAQVKTIVTETLVDYATTAYVDAAIAKAAAAEREITTADIAEAIEAALADYDLTVQDRIDALEKALTEKIEAYFIGYDAEEVVTLLSKVAKAMNAEQWAAATVMVTRVLKKASALFDKVVNNSYTQDRKAEINAIMGKINGLNTGVVIFKTISNKAGSYLDDAHYDYMHSGDQSFTGVDVRTASAKILTDLTVFILRAATVKEISGIEAAIDKATAVATFKEDIAAWRNDLYTIGEVVPVIADKAKNTQAKWSGLNGDHGTMYHNVVYKNGSVQKAQVATAAHRAQYNEDVANLEKLVVEYTLESMRFGTSADSASFGAYTDAVKALYSITANGKITGYAWVAPATYKGETWLGMNVSALTGTQTAAPAGYSFIGIFAGIDSSKVPAAAQDATYAALKTRNWVPNVYGDADKFGYVMQGYYDNQFLDPEIKVDLAAGKWAQTDSELKQLLNTYTAGTATGGYKAVTLAETYNALAQMIADAENANAKANAIFTGWPTDHADAIFNTGYLWHIGHDFKDTDTNKAGHQCGCALWSDDKYVSALKDYMVEHTEDETYAQVPDHWEIPVWLTPVYDVTGTDAPWQLMDNENAQTVDVYFNYAHNINGEGYMPESYDFISRYDLYLKLVDQAWKLLYEKYKSYAAQILLTMRNDFRVAAKAAVVANGANGATYTGANADAAAALDLKLIDVDLAKKYTEAFLENYYEGKNGWAWSIGNKVVKQVGPSYNMEGLDHYYDYNDVAQRQNVVGGAYTPSTIHSDVIGALKASQLLIDIELDSVTVGPRKEILTEAENFKNSGKTEFEWKKANIGRVQDAFDEELAVAMANFEEIMYRYMHKEINEAYVNLAYAAINALGAGETVNALNPHADDNYDAGVATYFSKNPAGAADQYAAEMAHFMQVYVTGYAANAVAGYAQGYNDVRNDKGALVGMTYKTSASYPNGVTVVPADVFNKLNANVLSAADFAVGETIAYPATAALANAKAIYADAINVMANAAVKFRFNDYIQHAKDAAYFAYLGYIAVAPGIEARLVLDAEYNEAVNALTIIQYYSERGLIADMDYLNTYVTQILGVAIANNSPYYTLIAKDTNYAAQLKNIKSSTAMKDGEAAKLNYIYTVNDAFKNLFKQEWVGNVDTNKNGKIEGAENYAGDILVIVPQSPMNGLASDNNYFATGSAALAFDMALNGNAKADNGTKLY